MVVACFSVMFLPRGNPTDRDGRDVLELQTSCIRREVAEVYRIGERNLYMH
jgi:hypothetical protein